MNRFFIVLVLLVAGIIGVGFYRGWFQLTVDHEKIQADKEKVLGHPGKEKPDDPTGQVNEPEPRP